jgi:hypothetical protein
MMPTLDWTSMIEEWKPPEKTERELTSAQKSDMNELLGAFGYPPHFAVKPPVPATPAATADDETPPAPSKEAELDAQAAALADEIALLKSAIAVAERKRAREKPASDPTPALDRKALLDAAVEGARKKTEQKARERAAKILRKAGL